MSTVPKIQNRIWTPQILPHITEKSQSRWRETAKGSFLIALCLLAIAALFAWPELPR